MCQKVANKAPANLEYPGAWGIEKLPSNLVILLVVDTHIETFSKAHTSSGKQWKQP
jgi:hypothetical protein